MFHFPGIPVFSIFILLQIVPGCCNLSFVIIIEVDGVSMREFLPGCLQKKTEKLLSILKTVLLLGRSSDDPLVFFSVSDHKNSENISILFIKNIS